MGERVEGMRGALRKANDILFEEELHRIEADMRAELEVEMERLETEALEREERLREKKCYTDYVEKKIGFVNN